jgi:hypothetical protein
MCWVQGAIHGRPGVDQDPGLIAHRHLLMRGFRPAHRQRIGGTRDQRNAATLQRAQRETPVATEIEHRCKRRHFVWRSSTHTVAPQTAAAQHPDERRPGLAARFIDRRQEGLPVLAEGVAIAGCNPAAMKGRCG